MITTCIDCQKIRNNIDIYTNINQRKYIYINKLYTTLLNDVYKSNVISKYIINNNLYLKILQFDKFSKDLTKIYYKKKCCLDYHKLLIQQMELFNNYEIAQLVLNDVINFINELNIK